MKSKTKKVIAPPWHPNFRLVEALPDTKVVRTDFIVNTIAVAIALWMLFLMVSNEMRAFEAGNRVAAAQKYIEEHKSQNDKTLKLGKKFSEEAKKIQELGTFYETPPFIPAELVSELGKLRPAKMYYDRLTLGEVVKTVQLGKGKQKTVTGTQLVVAGTVQGVSPEDLALIENFKQKLLAHPLIKPLVKNPKEVEVSVRRDVNAEAFRFTIAFVLGS